MSGFLYMLLFSVFGNALCNPPHYNVQPQKTEFSPFYYPSNDIDEEVKNVKQLSIYSADWIKPAKVDNRLVAKFTQQLDNFHKRLTKTVLDSKPGQNVIYSPISISILLMMVAFGSRGKTLNEILRETGLEFNTRTLMGFHDLVDIMENVDGVDLELANVIFASKNFDIVPDYRQRIVTHLKSELRKIDFENTKSAAQEINDWCKKQTKNQITEIVNSDDLSDILLMLANAVYFKGDWMIPFDIADTEDEPFYISKNQTVNVPMMYINNEFSYGRISELDTFFVELPYVHGENDRDIFSMFILVPINHNLELLEKNLDLINFKHLDLYEENVHIKLPRFKIQSTLDVKPIFEKMGMTSMFKGDADFRGLLDHQSIYLSKVVQKASLTVNEKGSIAAAVSAASFSDRMAASMVTVNQPFICAIVLKSLGLPVFYARVVDPTSSN
ncbi:antichymotrypsin-2-like [Chelonus insularis]|uniref:antichymotrypsin-2-like n=1 Tax=Chelonus insularis TaxID=460826 RepID=UPI001588D38A|nr:antichymotrypsin-2-like [Chelonus insularis]